MVRSFPRAPGFLAEEINKTNFSSNTAVTFIVFNDSAICILPQNNFKELQ